MIMSERRTRDVPCSYFHPSQQPANAFYSSFLVVHSKHWSPSHAVSTWAQKHNTRHRKQSSVYSCRSDHWVQTHYAVIPLLGFKINSIMCLMHSRAMGFSEWQDTYVRVTCTAAWTYQGIFICWALIKDLPSLIPPTKWDKTGLSNVAYARNWSSLIATVILS